jgi:hypothetical protein
MTRDRYPQFQARMRWFGLAYAYLLAFLLQRFHFLLCSTIKPEFRKSDEVYEKQYNRDRPARFPRYRTRCHPSEGRRRLSQPVIACELGKVVARLEACESGEADEL